MYLQIKHVFLLSFVAVVVSFIPFVVSAQGGGISGIVLKKGSSVRLSDVNVVNTRTNKRVTTNTFGVFIIEASVGDSLSFTKTGYGPIKTAVFTQDDILIEMQEGLTIETIVVSRLSKEAEMRDMLDDYSKKGVYNGGKNTLGTYLGSPATALYNLFGRDAKNAKRFSKLMDREIEESGVDRVFNKTSVSELTGLEGDELQSFMDLYRPSYSRVQYWGQYDFMNYVKTSLETWDKNGRPKSVRLPKLEIPPQER
ncbi:hypothetical protein ORI89_15065 [Sphingobacterium sp. UT-1RO-CII-1]|uniref:hypothetical protein n=1 Tax=Sphingobacterium sp. UT-1RO-CII-1 TaxID=2995225 RepID=UPI00227BD96A|nr:hypothetical protein [Sphingobacterium sp. UT-1RO-CII-1]MCY4780979.1 hypothetical protein [Sphingobacterium sp. UT-1RO-CII-1]